MKNQYRSPADLLSDESFCRWIAGESSDQETYHWERWRLSSEENNDLYSEAMVLRDKTSFPEIHLPDIDAEWEKLEAQITAGEMEHFVNVQSSSPQTSVFPVRKAAIGLLAAAAMLLVVFLNPFGGEPNDALENMVTKSGERTTIELPDGSQVTLSANSRVSFPKKWIADQPYPFTLEGEGYFVIKSRQRNSSGPFIVQTADGLIRVTGTRFVVSERGTGTQVVLEEGQVIVSSGDRNSASKNDGVMMNPGDLLLFRQGDQPLSPSQVNIEPYTTWWKDQLVFKRTLFSEIIERLETTYGVQVEVRDANLLSRRITGKIKNLNLQVTTLALAEAMGIRVYNDGELIIFQGDAR